MYEAKGKIKNALKEERKKVSEDGREMLERKFNHLKIDFTVQNINELANYFKLPSSQELFYRVAVGNINLKHLKDFIKEDGSLKHKAKSSKKSEAKEFEELITQARGNSNMLVIGEDLQKIDYKLAHVAIPLMGMMYLAL